MQRPPTESLSGLLDRAAELWPDRPFLLGDGNVVSFGEFHHRVERVAGALSELGVARGSRWAVILPSQPALLTLWLALARLGAVLVPLHPESREEEVRGLLLRSRAEGIVTDGARAPLLAVAQSARVRVVVGDSRPPGALGWAELEEGPRVVVQRPAGRDLATILFTSGTTGEAKGARLTHVSYVWPAFEFVRFMEVKPADRFLGCLPLYHLAGQSFATSAIAGGAGLAIVERFRGREFWQQVGQHRLTLVRYIGEMLAVLAAAPAEPERSRDCPVRAVYGGGARPEVIERFVRRFGIIVVEGYGLTETNTVLCNTLAEQRPGSIGRPLPYCRVQVGDAEGRALPAGALGEIQIERNPVLMEGYEGNDGLTRAAFAGSWFRTGDLGCCDREGTFFFVSRRKDLIRRRGENIAPVEIESVLERHPAVAKACVVGVPDGFGGEEIKAYVTLSQGDEATPWELARWCARYLAPFKTPRFIEICNDLPMTATHKVRRGDLRVRGSMLGTSIDVTTTATTARLTDGGQTALGGGERC